MDLSSLSRAYMNKEDDSFPYFKKIAVVDGFENLLCHGTKNTLYHESNIGIGTEYNAREVADIIKNDENLSGKNIRLLACNTGELTDGIAQQLADELGVKILAPSEKLWINENGDLFISNSKPLAEMWYAGEKVYETGKWVLFEPRKERNDGKI